jgi:hypothetical protein
MVLSSHMFALYRINRVLPLAEPKEAVVERESERRLPCQGRSGKSSSSETASWSPCIQWGDYGEQCNRPENECQAVASARRRGHTLGITSAHLRLA